MTPGGHGGSFRDADVDTGSVDGPLEQKTESDWVAVRNSHEVTDDQRPTPRAAAKNAAGRPNRSYTRHHCPYLTRRYRCGTGSSRPACLKLWKQEPCHAIARPGFQPPCFGRRHAFKYLVRQSLLTRPSHLLPWVFGLLESIVCRVPEGSRKARFSTELRGTECSAPRSAGQSFSG
ncbi:hypothetical protein MES4922_60133 [Mesorhizobium ventifaucium]|uniref:Uncharacterized protein n=1 Tax=Mesorhizobium ventifaucium TaxID=666020 RepID=A0ABN8KDI6_9HYPH|nr:hypothetical protein MES4922_60133 [Mesorhizobium ventifaucium]